MKILLVLFLASSISCFAALPVTYDDILRIYGRPTGSAIDSHFKEVVAEGHPTGFESNGIKITISPNRGTLIKTISYERDNSFSDLEIADILKPISGTEDWVKKDDTTWVLPKAKATARWDGEGKIVVTDDAGHP